MSERLIDLWIRSFGRRYRDLVADGAIPPMPLQKLYPRRLWLSLTPCEGIEMDFTARHRRLQTIFICLISLSPLLNAYRGRLPAPFRENMSREYVRRTFGTPLQSRGPVEMPEPIGMTGGTDTYRLYLGGKTEIKVQFCYGPLRRVDTLVFSKLAGDVRNR